MTQDWSTASDPPEWLTVRTLGEQGLLKRLQLYCPAEWVGDDAALLTVQPGHQLVVSTDVLVDGVHFSLGVANPALKTMSPADAGWRAIAANLSDLAAMGATPLALTVGLSLPGEVPVAWVEALYRGMADCAQTYGTAIAGGDTCRSPVLTLSVTALGEVQRGRALLRSAAQVGDTIVATGVHGASRAGLELLLSDRPVPELTAPQRQRLIQSHQRPRPRLDIAAWLQTVQADLPGRAIAAMDSSDGLADAVVQLCRASGVGARLERSQLPVPPELLPWRSLEDVYQWVLYGGEDFELVLCLPPSLAQTLLNHWPEARVVGEITASPLVWMGDRHDPAVQIPLSLQQGFQHFTP